MSIDQRLAAWARRTALIWLGLTGTACLRHYSLAEEEKTPTEKAPDETPSPPPADAEPPKTMDTPPVPAPDRAGPCDPCFTDGKTCQRDSVGTFCTECVSDADCSAKEEGLCSLGRCIYQSACNNVNDCGEVGVCDGVRPDTPGTCRECNRSNPCGDGRTCEDLRCQVLKCDTDAQCGAWVCTAGNCQECNSTAGCETDSECSQGRCILRR